MEMIPYSLMGQMVDIHQSDLLRDEFEQIVADMIHPVFASALLRSERKFYTDGTIPFRLLQDLAKEYPYNELFSIMEFIEDEREEFFRLERIKGHQVLGERRWLGSMDVFQFKLEGQNLLLELDKSDFRRPSIHYQYLITDISEEAEGRIVRGAEKVEEIKFKDGREVLNV